MLRCYCDCTITCFDIIVDAENEEIIEDEAVEQCNNNNADNWSCECRCEELEK